MIKYEDSELLLQRVVYLINKMVNLDRKLRLILLNY